MDKKIRKGEVGVGKCMLKVDCNIGNKNSDEN
jgi:hypothetical protein